MIREARRGRAAAEPTRKEMKGPDRFQVLAAEAATWVAENRRPLLLGLGVALAFLVAGVAASALLRSREERAGGALYRALDAADGQISPVPLPGVDRQIFRTDGERQRAVLEAALEARREHPGPRAAATAALAAGQAHLRLGEWELAGSAFREYLAAAPEDEPLRFAALDGLARVEEGKGDLAQAARAFERAGREVSTFADRAALERARVAARAGEVAEARKILQGFPAEFKDSLLKDEARERLARLGGG